MQNPHVGAPADSRKQHLLRWLSHPSPAPLATTRSVNRSPEPSGRSDRSFFSHARTTLAISAIGMLALAATACGSEEASSTPNDDQPAAVSAANQGQEQSSNQAGSRDSERPTDGNGSDAQHQEPSGNSDTSASNATSQPTATAKPTPEPSPTATPKPGPTATPEPTPTPTMVPTPTRDPKNVMEGAMWAHPEVREYNGKLIAIATAPYVADYITAYVMERECRPKLPIASGWRDQPIRTMRDDFTQSCQPMVPTPTISLRIQK